MRRMRSSAAGSTQSLNGAPLRSAPGLARQDRHVMPGIVIDLAAAERARMLRDNPPVLADDDAIGVGVDFDRAADRAGAHRISVVVEPHQAGLRHRGRQRVESVEAAAIGNELRTLVLERPPRSSCPALLGMSVRLGPGDAFVDRARRSTRRSS